MITYATPEDFMRILSRTEAAELSQIDEESDLANVLKIQDALERASADINSELAFIGYALPLVNVSSAQLTDICVYLAWEKLNIYGDIRETVERLSDDARSRLKRVRLFDTNGALIPINVAPTTDARYIAPSYVSDRAYYGTRISYDDRRVY